MCHTRTAQRPEIPGRIYDNNVDLYDEEYSQVLAAAYKQYMLNRVTEAVKSSLEAYREYNKPLE